MPAPKNANTEAARAASLASRARAKREGELRAARVLLRVAGHIVIDPDDVAWIRENADASVVTFIRGLTERPAP